MTDLEIGERWFWWAIEQGFGAMCDEFNYPNGPAGMADYAEREAIENARGEILCRQVPAWPTPDGRVLSRRRMETVAKRVSRRLDRARDPVEYLQLWAISTVMDWLGVGLDGDRGSSLAPDQVMRRHKFRLAVIDEDGSLVTPRPR